MSPEVFREYFPDLNDKPLILVKFVGNKAGTDDRSIAPLKKAKKEK